MIFNEKNEYLIQFKDKLLKRRIKQFDKTNWWKWGRIHYASNLKRVYVNVKTRNKNPFFTHSCKNYDGSILAIFPKNQKTNVEVLKDKLNKVNWQELGFICDNRYIFSQKSLENSLLPASFIQ